MKSSELVSYVRPPFCELFPTKPVVLEVVKESMAEWGYDQSQPIIVWDEGQAIIDGHTRLRAAQEVGITELPVHYKNFADEDEALVYAIHLQRNRRNLTDAEILRCIEALDRKRKQGEGQEREGGKFQPKASDEAIGKSACETARVVGISRAKVEPVRAVLEYGDPEVVRAVKEGRLTIHRAYLNTQERRQAEVEGKSVFNRTNENIEWATWTWNPVTGCRHGCPYCYARDMAARFYGENGHEPKFHPERLSAPANTKPPKPSAPIGERNVFVCSMADLFGEWVPQEWIDAVLEAVRAAPLWNFLFLTKNPARLMGID